MHIIHTYMHMYICTYLLVSAQVMYIWSTKTLLKYMFSSFSEETNSPCKTGEVAALFIEHILIKIQYLHKLCVSFMSIYTLSKWTMTCACISDHMWPFGGTICLCKGNRKINQYKKESYLLYDTSFLGKVLLKW